MSNKEDQFILRNIDSAEEYERFHHQLKARKEFDEYEISKSTKWAAFWILLIIIVLALVALVYSFVFIPDFRDQIAQIFVNNLVSAIIVIAGILGITRKTTEKSGDML